MSVYHAPSLQLPLSAFGEITSGLKPTESITGARPLKLCFSNCSSRGNLSVSWVDTSSTLRNARELPLSASHVEQTFEGHSFAISGANSSEAVACYRIVRARPFESSPRTVLIVDKPIGGGFSLTCAPGDVTQEDELLGALVLMEEEGDGDIPLLKRYLAAIATHPDNPKYRVLKLSNAHFQRAAGYSLGGLHLLSTLGFVPGPAPVTSEHNEITSSSSTGSTSSTSSSTSSSSSSSSSRDSSTPAAIVPGEVLMMARPSARMLVLIRQALEYLDELQSRRVAEALAVSPDCAQGALRQPNSTPQLAVATNPSTSAKDPPWHRLRRGVGGAGEEGNGGADEAWVLGGHWVSHEDHFNRAARNRSMPPPPPPGRRRDGRR